MSEALTESLMSAWPAVALCLVLTLALARQRVNLAKSERATAKVSNKLSQAAENLQRLQRDIEHMVRELPFCALLVERDTGLVTCVSRYAEEHRLGMPDDVKDLRLESIFQGRHPDLLPGIRARLATGIRGRVELHDRVPMRPGTTDGQAIEVAASLAPVGSRVLVTLRWKDEPGARPMTRAKRDNSVIRSILNESNVVRGLEKAVELLHAREHAGHGVGFCVSLLDSRSRTLRAIWSRGLEGRMQQSLNTIPVIFGYAPNSTAALLSKAVQVDKTAFRDSFSFDELEMERLGEWTSFPITSSAGEVLGTFDLFVFDGVRFDVSPDAISNFLFVASVLLERHQALSTIVNQARADRLIKRIGEKLLSADAGRELEVLYHCIDDLQAHAELASGRVGLIFCDEAGGLAQTGTLFEAGARMGEGRQWLTEQFHRLATSSGPVTRDGGEGAELPELVSLTAGEDSAIQAFAESLPIRPETRQAVWSVFPMASGGHLEGLLLFADTPAVTSEQNALLSTVAPIFASHLVRTRLLRELERRAHHDPLTGLYNRGHIEEKLKAEVERSLRYRNALSVILFDIDHFKQINDTYGHDVGDEVLQAVARRVERSLRSVDRVGRWGGEEFLVILAETGKDSALLVAENLRRTVAEGEYGLPSPVTVSVGVAQFRSSDGTGSLVKRADQALYRAKQNGRNQVAEG